MICVKFTAFCDLRADLRIRLATLRQSVRKFWFLRRLASPFGRGFRRGLTCILGLTKDLIEGSQPRAKEVFKA